jgi:hypothetical protein
MSSVNWLRTSLILASTCILLAAFSAPAVAECKDGQCKHKNHEMPTYADIDQDADGAVNSEEFYAFRSARMAARAAEGRKLKNAGNAPTFEDLDLDGDGNLSADEFEKHHAQCPMCGGEHKGKHKNKTEDKDVVEEEQD